MISNIKLYGVLFSVFWFAGIFLTPKSNAGFANMIIPFAVLYYSLLLTHFVMSVYLLVRCDSKLSALWMIASTIAALLVIYTKNNFYFMFKVYSFLAMIALNVLALTMLRCRKVVPALIMNST